MLKPLDPQRCPVDQALEVLSGKWKPRILWRLQAGTLRFNERQRAIAPVTQRMLTPQLRELERDGLVIRTVCAEVPPRVEYSLTAPARHLTPSLRAVGQWLLDHHAELRAISSSSRQQGGVPEPALGVGNVRALRARSIRSSA
jgi:DNA-binding HxlR family transcriptional regulator